MSAAVVSNTNSQVSSVKVHGYAEDDDKDGVWVNGKFYPNDDGFEEIEVRSARPPRKEVKNKVKSNRPNRRFGDIDEFNQ